ncbi:MAG: fbxl13 [Chlamydiia bacterium]|nr:fbxl13 [Chlamydiia bacterium]
MNPKYYFKPIVSAHDKVTYTPASTTSSQNTPVNQGIMQGHTVTHLDTESDTMLQEIAEAMTHCGKGQSQLDRQVKPEKLRIKSQSESRVSETPRRILSQFQPLQSSFVFIPPMPPAKLLEQRICELGSIVDYETGEIYSKVQACLQQYGKYIREFRSPLRECSPNDLKILFKSCPNLQKLTLCDQLITDECLKIIGEHSSIISLDLSGNPDITDSGLAYLAPCIHLTHLHLYGLVHLTNQALEVVGKLKELEFLDIGGEDDSATLVFYEKMTDKGLLCLQNPKLRTLYLTDLNYVSDTGIQSILKASQGLSKVTIKACQRMTDRSLQAFAGHSALEKVHIIKCDSISAAGIKTLLNDRPNLDLRIERCRFISSQTFERMKSK